MKILWKVEGGGLGFVKNIQLIHNEKGKETNKV